MGKAGAGKSYMAVKRAREAVEAGRHLMTNLPLIPEKWAEYAELVHQYDDTLKADGWLAKPADWDDMLEQRWMTGEGSDQKGPLLIVDEVVRVFSPARLRGTSDDVGKQRQHAVLIQTSVENLIATHRHARLDIIFLGQTHKQLPDWLKPQIHEWVELKNQTGAGVPGFSWAVFDTYWGYRQPIRHSFSRYDKKIFELYRSHAMAGEDVDEGRDRAHGFGNVKWWMRWQVWLLVVSIAALGGWGVPNAMRIVRDLTGQVDDGEIAGVPGLGGSVEVAPEASSPASMPAPAILPAEPARSMVLPWQGEPPPGWPASSVPFRGQVGPWWMWADGSMRHVSDTILGQCRVELVRSSGAVIGCLDGRVIYVGQGDLTDGRQDDDDGGGLPEVSGGSGGGVPLPGP